MSAGDVDLTLRETPDQLRDLEPIRCRCRRARLGLIGPHRDHVTTYRRSQWPHLVPDETALAGVRL